MPLVQVNNVKTQAPKKQSANDTLKSMGKASGMFSPERLKEKRTAGKERRQQRAEKRAAKKGTMAVNTSSGQFRSSAHMPGRPRGIA